MTSLTSASAATGPVDVHWLGTIDYNEAWDEQRRMHAEVLAGSVGPTAYPPAQTLRNATAAGVRSAAWT